MSEPDYTGILKFLLSTESEVRLRGHRKIEANFGFGTLDSYADVLACAAVCSVEAASHDQTRIRFLASHQHELCF